MAKQANVDHRRVGTQLNANKAPQDCRPDQKRARDYPGRKLPFQRRFSAVDQQQDRHNQHQSVRDVQRLLRSPLLGRDKTRRQGDHQQHNGNVDQKHGTPVEVGQQHPAHQRAKGGPAGPDGSPDAKGNVTLTRIREERADPGQRRGNDHRRADCQRGPRGNQPPRRGGKRRRQRREAKQSTSHDQQALKADAIPERPHRQHHAGHHQRIDINDPQQFIAAGIQSHTQRRGGNVQHRGVNRNRDIDQHDNH